MQARTWLPPGKRAAVCLSIDDIHPGTSAEAYEAGGDLERGSLGRLRTLQRRHPQLKLSLSVTPDWRLRSLIPDTLLLRRIPWLRRHVHWTRLHPRGTFRIDRHPELVRYLNALEGCEVVLHGLTHAHRGPLYAVEFQDESAEQCAASIRTGLEIFGAAKLTFVRGFAPPAWNAPPPLIEALERCDFDFLISARDIHTPISDTAVTAMSGLRGVSVIHPQRIGRRGMVHLTANFQATSPIERAVAIVDRGGVLHIKAHIFKSGGGHVMQDGLDELYVNYLDALMSELERRYGDSLWWPHLSEVAARVRQSA
jgi:Uncharacterized protein conserved in bacteria (DUF2334)